MQRTADFELSRRSALAMALGAAVAPTSAVAASGGGIARALAAYIDQAVREDDFSGVVLLAQHGRPVFQAAYGLADRDHNARNRLDTRFNLASMNKMFTATAILRLVEQGKVALDAPIGRYLPDYPDPDIAKRVKIEHLLTHSSGLGNVWEALAKRPANEVRATKDYIPLFAGAPLEFEPGSRLAYSNTGYIVLGLVIEAVAGMPYHDHIRGTLTRPLGMGDTDAHRADDAVPRRANGYFRSEERAGVWSNNLFVSEILGSPAGGGYSTAADMLRFANAFSGDRLFSPRTRANATNGRFDYSKGRYGLGFSIDTVNGHTIVGHTGGHYGIANELMIFEDLGWTAIILTNGDVDGYWGVSAKIRDLIAGPSDVTRAFWHSRALVDLTVSDGLAAARTLDARTMPKLSPRSSVIEVEAAKYRHRGQLQSADRLDALAKIFTETKG